MPADYTDTRPETRNNPRPSGDTHIYTNEPVRTSTSTGTLVAGAVIAILAILFVFFLFGSADDDPGIPVETTNSIEVVPDDDGVTGGVDVQQEPGAAIDQSTDGAEPAPADNAAPAGDDAATGN